MSGAFAWVTLLTQPDYLRGVETLQRSLRASGSPWPLVVMVTPAIDDKMRQHLQTRGCRVQEVPVTGPDPALAHRYANERFAEVWSKLAVWRLTEYQRVAFLDADMLVINNMDEVFSLPLAADTIAACHACRCNPQRIASYPESWRPENCYYSWCDDPGMHGHPPASLDNYLNGGFLVLTPDEAMYQQMMQRLAEKADISAYVFAEQDFLNEVFRDRWQPLHYGYNALKTLALQHPQMWDLARVKNIHYIIDKPWEKTPQPGDKWYELHKLWWEYA
ncbi:UNVERIFIED_ORG: alpha-N-acetylglucosamine transferase [Kosakonia oryzae]|uniref:Glycosyl transferase family 8 n=1 Tax=Kosakonia radicincitans TaxID=283686 RepID=A0AAX2EL53_9ENTR|nr:MULTISPECIES: glycosyltransferase family 8 protein [Kosakonia]MDP9565203.1 alpha-N-acetylglucosamine transferase [Kosakonia oryzae]NCF04866.1 glycosyltransferase family 8 protein [Kosakonia sp. MH5]SFD87503.1 Glycosyl transferase family 8 [Kosakonia radicincitans]SFQ95836.1 Glycosyl transferase family 8 [Kosakonia radicincitans]SFT36137.1 Glycosyl transferase family 8 [Kosakonia radicincitans]